MIKKIVHMKKSLWLPIVILVALIAFGCKKNESGPPVITAVRVIDTTKIDSLFTQAIPGTEIVIEGSNLGGCQAIFFNDTSAYFNPVYVTNNNIIVVIPATAQTAATNPSVPSVIKLITNHGMTTFSFSLYLPTPVVSSISFNNTGSVVYINGANFEGIKKITFPVTGSDTALSYKVNATYTQITANIPPGTAFYDSVRVFCTFGTGSFPYPPPMSISSVSDENAVAGTTITINGSNFIGITSVVFPGEITGTNVQTLSVTQISVTVPSGITASDSLRVVGVLGTAASPQLFDSYINFPSPGYLSTFENQWASDNTSFVGWTGGYANAATTATNYPGGTGAAGILLQQSPMSANSAAGSQGNAGLLQLNDVPWVASTSASIANYSMKFEVAVDGPWSQGEIWIAVGDWYTWSSYTARYAPWSTAANGIFQPTGWLTVTIPLTQFISGNQFYQSAWNPAGSPASHFSDYPTTGVAFMIVNDQGTAVPANAMNIAVDNVRIVQGQ
jgi:hypothetical protein